MSDRPDILAMLQGGDRRSIGRANEVAALVERDPSLLADLLEGLRSGDPLARMRAADAAEKATASRPELLQPYKAQLLAAAASRQQEVRWHVAQMLPRLELTRAERRNAFDLLLAFLADRSNIVKTFAMQALADLAQQDQALKPQVMGLLSELTVNGSPSMRSRGRKLLHQLGEPD